MELAEAFLRKRPAPVLSSFRGQDAVIATIPNYPGHESALK
jgi:hypothetical protein